jgi:proteasome beta subunit
MTAAYLSAGTSSFSELLASAAPGLLPGSGGLSVPSGLARELPHGTTIVAASFDGGVVMTGDRRATSGNMISQRDIEKVFRSDEFSCIGIAGVAGIGIDLVRLYQVELEHYEKLEGRALSLEGKANRLAGMVRANLAGAMQGLVVVPLFAGYDSMEASAAILACMQALYDAADDDSATGGPDIARRIWPIVATVTADGYRRLSDEEAGTYAEAVINERMREPDGPTSPLRLPTSDSE